MAEELYQNFGIIYLDRFETKTNFRINDNDNVKAHLESILKLLCLFTVAIFETDSVERKRIAGQWRTNRRCDAPAALDGCHPA